MKYKIDCTEQWAKWNLETSFEGSKEDAINFLAQFAETKWREIASKRRATAFPRVLGFSLYDETGEEVTMVIVTASFINGEVTEAEYPLHRCYKIRAYDVWRVIPEEERDAAGNAIQYFVRNKTFIPDAKTAKR